MAGQFHIITIANDLSAYAAMRVSMEKTGYDSDRCRFTLLDNSVENRHEPYSVLRNARDDGVEPYILLIHQDLLFNSASSMEVLGKQIHRLNETDPNWALAGNAGVDLRGSLVRNMDDPHGSFREADRPRRAISLDENFLLLRRDNYALPSESLSGFHFYGTDLCLAALMQGKHAYVIEMPVCHLSAGQPGNQEYVRIRKQMIQIWRPKLMIGLVQSLPSEFRVSKWRWLEWILNHRYPAGLLRRLRIPLVKA